MVPAHAGLEHGHALSQPWVSHHEGTGTHDHLPYDATHSPMISATPMIPTSTENRNDIFRTDQSRPELLSDLSRADWPRRDRVTLTQLCRNSRRCQLSAVRIREPRRRPPGVREDLASSGLNRRR